MSPLCSASHRVQTHWDSLSTLVGLVQMISVDSRKKVRVGISAVGRIDLAWLCEDVLCQEKIAKVRRNLAERVPNRQSPVPLGPLSHVQSS